MSQHLKYLRFVQIKLFKPRKVTMTTSA